MIKVGIYGYRGYIGSHIKRRLEALNYDVVSFKRDEIYDDKFYLKAKDVSYIILVNGVSIMIPWTKRNRQKIFDSRIKPNLRFQELIQKGLINPDAIIAGSAIGIYDDEHVHHDNSVHFEHKWIGKLVQDWENSLSQVSSSRIVHVRIGNVIGRDSAFLEPMKMMKKLRLKMILGSGNQEISYIHINDLVNVFAHCIKDQDISGPVNAVNGDIISMEKFADTWFQNRPKHLGIHVPAFLIRFFMGERANLVLGAKKVLPKKLFDRHFSFEFPNIQSTIQDCLKN